MELLKDGTVRLTKSESKVLGYDMSCDNLFYNAMLTEGKIMFSLYEGLIKSYPAKKVVEYLRKYVNLDPSMIRLENEYKIIVDIPKDEDYEKEITRVMVNLCGYFVAHRIEGDTFIRLQFEKKYQEVMNDVVKAFKYLVHGSPEKYENKILKYGLCPKSKNEKFDYPERIYLFGMQGTKEDIFRKMAEIAIKKNGFDEQGVYNFYIIDTTKISENAKFYTDPNTSCGFWTYDNIPPTAIVKYIKKDLSDFLSIGSVFS